GAVTVSRWSNHDLTTHRIEIGGRRLIDRAVALGAGPGIVVGDAVVVLLRARFDRVEAVAASDVHVVEADGDGAIDRGDARADVEDEPGHRRPVAARRGADALEVAAPEGAADLAIGEPLMLAEPELKAGRALGIGLRAAILPARALVLEAALVSVLIAQRI